MTTKIWTKSFWVTETVRGGMEYRARTKVLMATLPFVLSALLFSLLIVIEGLPSGPGVIMALAYGVIVLMVALMLMAILISILDYLRRFED